MRPRLLVIDPDRPDSDAPRLSWEEHAALVRAQSHGLAIALVTEVDVGCASFYRISPHDPADGLARLCDRTRIPFAEVAVVASRPRDLAIALEAGTVIALEDAGPACRATADYLVPRRATGGLARAIALVIAVCDAASPTR